MANSKSEVMKRSVGRPKTEKTIEKENIIKNSRSNYFNINKSSAMAPIENNIRTNAQKNSIEERLKTSDTKLDKVISLLEKNNDRLKTVEDRLNALEKIEERLSDKIKEEVKLAEERLRKIITEEIKKQMDSVVIEKAGENSISKEAIVEVKQVYNDILKEKDEREKAEKKNNIVITGISFEKERIKEEVSKWITEKLNINVEVTEAWKIKEEMTGVKMQSFHDKMNVIRNKNMLKKTKIYIKDDLTYNERQIQRKIIERAVQYREKNQETYVSVRYRKLIVGNEEYVWSDEEGKLLLKESMEERELDGNNNKQFFRDKKNSN